MKSMKRQKKEHAVGVKMYPSMCQIYVFFLFDILLKARKLLCFVNTVLYENAVKKNSNKKKHEQKIDNNRKWQNGLRTLQSTHAVSLRCLWSDSGSKDIDI